MAELERWPVGTRVGSVHLIAACVNVIRLVRSRERDGAGKERAPWPVPDEGWLAVASDPEELFDARPDVGHIDSLERSRGASHRGWRQVRRPPVAPRDRSRDGKLKFGTVSGAVLAVLVEADSPMRYAEIHAKVEQRLGMRASSLS